MSASEPGGGRSFVTFRAKLQSRGRDPQDGPAARCGPESPVAIGARATGWRGDKGAGGGRAHVGAGGRAEARGSGCSTSTAGGGQSPSREVAGPADDPPLL